MEWEGKVLALLIGLDGHAGRTMKEDIERLGYLLFYFLRGAAFKSGMLFVGKTWLAWIGFD